MEKSRFDELTERLANDPFSRFMGIKLLELRPGYARLSMEVKPEMINVHGVTHGGAVFSLADAAFAAASNSHGQVAVALNMNITYIAPTFEGTILYATGMEDNLGRRTAVYRMTVEDERGQLVAIAEGIVYRKDKYLIEGIANK